jgi:hypothetical protein
MASVALGFALFHTRDHSISSLQEPREENSGLMQGAILARQRVPRDGSRPGLHTTGLGHGTGTCLICNTTPQAVLSYTYHDT